MPMNPNPSGARTRRILQLTCIAIVALGCKSAQMIDVENFEREACACPHRDVACASSAHEHYKSATTSERDHWYDWSFDPAERQRRFEAAIECLRRVSSCSADDPCSPGSFCNDIRKDTHVGTCARWLAEGDTCDNSVDAVCSPGLHCETGFSELCEIGTCPGVCTKGPQTSIDGIPIAVHPHASASASASVSAAK